MRTILKGKRNAINNGDFKQLCGKNQRFPEAWLSVGGNRETSWMVRLEASETHIEINNATPIRAGVIQTETAALDVKEDKHWLITISYKNNASETKAYLRIYPLKANGDVAKPWEYTFGTGGDQDQYEQAVRVSVEIDALRLEAGILGQGSLSIYKLSAQPVAAPSKEKRVIRLRQGIRQINSIQTIGEIVKPIHLAMPIPLKLPVTVQANVNADTRNLTPQRDKVQIIGSSQVPIATSSSGRAQIEICGHEFHESIEDVTADQTILVTTARDVSALPRVSFAVYNFGSYDAYIQLELSPDGIHWAFEGIQHKVEPKTLVIAAPGSFLRYIRLSLEAQGSTKLRIWVQAQN